MKALILIINRVMTQQFTLDAQVLAAFLQKNVWVIFYYCIYSLARWADLRVC